MKFLKIICYIFFWIFTYIIPKKKNLYLFVNTNWKTFSWNARIIYKYILNNEKKIIPIYIWDEFIKANSLKSYYYSIIAKYIFIENDLSQISSCILAYQPWKIKIINLWHWEPIKKIWFDANLKSERKIKNKIFISLYKNFFNNKVILWTTWSVTSQINLNNSQFTDKYKITGLARNDIFFNEAFLEKNIKKDLSLEKYKIILYTPTYRDNWKKYEPLIINNEIIKILDESNYILLIKAHQSDDSIIINESKNIINISKLDYDIQDILYFTDILITDYSSIYIDFLLTNKPIIFYPFDKEIYLENRNMYFNYDDVTINETTAYNQNELENKIAGIKILISDKNYKTKYSKIKNIFHQYKKWGYCENILKEIKDYEKNTYNNSFN